MWLKGAYRKPDFLLFRSSTDGVTGRRNFGEQLLFGFLQEPAPWLGLLPPLLTLRRAGLQPPPLKQRLHDFMKSA